MSTKTTLLMVAVGGALLLATGPIVAHHQFYPLFDPNKPVTLRGTLTKMEWINPHAWIYLNVKSADGQVESWAIETGSPLLMETAGLKRTDFRPGIEVIVIGFASRNGTPTVAGWTITFPDRADRGVSFLLGR